VLVASGADLQSINPLVTVHPFAKQVQKYVLFLPLAAYDSLLKPAPRLASWAWRMDRTSLTFHVRKDVYWHDGRRTTAADVKWTLDAARDPSVAYPRASDLAGVAAVVQLDSFTVRVDFDQPQPMFPDVLVDLPILPEHRFRGALGTEIRSHPFNLQPVGNGPFAFVEHRPNQRWVFRRNDRFPAALGGAKVERLVVAIVDEATTKLAALTSGELDLAGINPAYAGFVEEDPRLVVIDYPVQFAVALVWNLRREPFTDVRVRRALTRGLDRELLVQAFLYGFGTVADGPVSPDHPWFEATARVEFDPARAERELDSVGWRRGPDGIRVKDGVRLEFELLLVSGDNLLEQMIQAQLSALGALVTLRQLELASFLALAQGQDRDYDALVTGVPGDMSLGYVRAMYDGASSGPLAYPGYGSEAFDSIMRAAGAARDVQQLEEAWREAQRILGRDLPSTWIYHARGVQGANRRLRGVMLDYRGELATVTDWWIDSGRN